MIIMIELLLCINQKEKLTRMTVQLLTKLSQNLLEILNDEEYDDITIEVGNDPHVKIFRAHMVILNYRRSPYLRRILSTNKKKNDGTLLNIKLSKCFARNFSCNFKVSFYIYQLNFERSEIIKRKKSYL